MKKLLLMIVLLLAACQPVDSPNKLRIISLIPSNTEILYELGLGDAVIGVSTEDDYPADVKTKLKFDGFNLNKEALLKARPTHIVTHESARNAQHKILADLKARGVTIIYVKEAVRLSQLDETFMQVAEAVDRVDEGRRLSQRVTEDIDDVIRRYPSAGGQRVFMEVSSAPEIYTSGSGTLFDDMITRLGAVNVFHDIDGWQPVSKEAIVRRNPDVLISTTGQSGAAYRQTIERRGSFNETTAVKQSRIDALNDDLFTRPGPRIAKGLEALATILADQ